MNRSLAISIILRESIKTTLAKAKEIDLIEIHWPSGQIDRSSNLNVNQKLIAIEGAEIKSHW